MLLQRFHEAWDRLEGTGATLGEDSGEEGGESRLYDTTCCCVELVVACGPADFLGTGPGCRAGLLCASGRRGQSLPPRGAAAWPYGACRTASGGGFALHEALWRRVAGVSEPHVVQFPPFGGSEAVA